MVSKKSTKDMSREEWLSERLKSIGGSDCAAILNLNPYTSAYALWAEKTGRITPEDISDKEAVRLGNDLEQYVAERFCEAAGKKVQRCNFILQNDQYPFAHANPDRMVVGEDSGLECKTTSSYEVIKRLRDGDVPHQWYCQCVHYMMVTGAKRWYLAALAFGSGFFWFTIERNDAEIDSLAACEQDFWELVISDTPPEIDGAESTTEAITTIYADSQPGTSIDLTAVAHHVEAYNALSRQIKQLEEMQDTHKNEICQYMAEAEKGTCGSTSVSWKSSSHSTFDKKRFEAENGKIPEQYYNKTVSRAFRVTTKKGA